MYSIYKIQIDKNQYMDEVCTLSNNLYNFALYQTRQFFFQHQEFLNYYVNYEICKHNENYKKLYSQVGQQVLKQVEWSFSNFFKAIKAYKKDPSKFTGQPKLPKYMSKGGKNIVTFPGQHIKIKDNHIIFPKSKYKLFIGKLNFDKIIELKIKPYRTYYEIIINYELNKESKKYEQVESNNRYIGVDLGINNFVTISDSSGVSRPVIIKGKNIKSINQYYNKQKAKLQSYVGSKGYSNRIDKLIRKRNNKIDCYMHQISSWITKYCIKNKISNIIVGQNKQWKTNVDIGKQNNQTFCSIPHSDFIFKLQYKCQRHNINFQTNEESYTSKCDSLSLEDLKNKPDNQYFGKRVYRGLFKSKNGQLINADINGSLNILRKVVGNDFISLLDRGLVMNPLTIIF